ncbi:MAG: inositol monophosphatase [Halobacteriales archaeon]
MSLPENEHLQVAKRAARTAGQELRRRFDSTDDFRYEGQRGVGEMVTPADEVVEEQIIADISETFPDDNFMSEENHADFAIKPRWVVDPIDGTTNFSNGLGHYSVSIAFEGKRRPDIGVVYYVPDDRMYTAVAGEGAYVDGERLELTGPSNLTDALVVTGFNSKQLEKNHMRLITLLESTQGIRRWGSAAAELAFIADGSFDIYFERSIDKWDVYAGILVVREAGGAVTCIETGNGIHYNYVLASPESLHQDLVAVLSTDR